MFSVYVCGEALAGCGGWMSGGDEGEGMWLMGFIYIREIEQW
jgi:hypothetical protein